MSILSAAKGERRGDCILLAQSDIYNCLVFVAIASLSHRSMQQQCTPHIEQSLEPWQKINIKNCEQNPINANNWVIGAVLAILMRNVHRHFSPSDYGTAAVTHLKPVTCCKDDARSLQRPSPRPVARRYRVFTALTKRLRYDNDKSMKYSVE